MGKVFCTFPPRQESGEPFKTQDTFRNISLSFSLSLKRCHIFWIPSKERYLPQPSFYVHLLTSWMRLLCLQPILGFLFLYWAEERRFANNNSNLTIKLNQSQFKNGVVRRRNNVTIKLVLYLPFFNDYEIPILVFHRYLRLWAMGPSRVPVGATEGDVLIH